MSTNRCWSGLSSTLEAGNRSSTCASFPRAGRESTPVLREADQGNATQGSQTARGNRLGRASRVSQCEEPDARTAHTRMICEQRLQSLVQKRGIGIWDYRLLDEEPIPDSLRFLVLKAAGGRCQLCGISAKERPLDVDHIIPRSREGETELANLQALCSKCNRSKQNQDETDFRSWPHPSADPDCAFCRPNLMSKAVEKNGSVFAGGYPSGSRFQEGWPLGGGSGRIGRFKGAASFLGQPGGKLSTTAQA
jgi:5-methylcytosine-specific restriction endonuclease McrA